MLPPGGYLNLQTCIPHTEARERLTGIGDWAPLVKLPLVGTVVKTAALDLPKRGLVCRTRLCIADPEAFPFSQAVFPAILGAEDWKEKPTHPHQSSQLSKLDWCRFPEKAEGQSGD